MNTLRYFTICFVISFMSLSVLGQNSLVKKAANAVFSLSTFRADGSLLDTSYGVFVSSNGEAISQWKPFVGASKAIVVDAKGKKYDVEGLIGANSLYDICKFQVKGLTPAAVVFPETDSNETQFWFAAYKANSPNLIPVSLEKKETFTQTTEASVQKKYSFYILNGKLPDNKDYSPIFNTKGEVVALSQALQANGRVNAVSALFPSEMVFQQLGNSANTLATSNIPTILPIDYKDAQVALMFASQQRKGDAYSIFVDYFISKFPTKPDGYEARARIYTADKKFLLAAADMEKAIEYAEDKASMHFSYSNMILQKEIYMPSDTFSLWNLDKALNEVEQAYRNDSNLVYLQHKAKVLYAKQDYQNAYNIYMQLQSTRMSGPENMYAATQCQQAMGADFSVLIQHMDSTIAVCPKPMTYQSAPYVFERGLMYQKEGIYRKAIFEYNDYEKFMVGNQLHPDFYYNRFICEREARLYKQALEDIEKAISLNPYEPIYLCEKGSLELRLRMADQAIASANKALIIDSSFADAYAILGAAQCVKGNKHEGLLNLERAKGLGYANADVLIKKYK